MRYRQVFVFIFICCFNEAHEVFIRDEKIENFDGGLEVSRKKSEEIPLKKKWDKNSLTNNENNIFKSKIEILGEVFRRRVDHLKIDNKIELIFLVDSSSSIGEENFKNELKFVKKLISDINVSPTDARVAVVTFATSVETHVNHLDATTQEHEKCTLLHKELPNVKYSGGNTFTLGALLEAQNILQNARPDAKRALFLITDGFSNNGYPVPIARELKEKGVTIFSFGIRNGNIEELYKISSKPEEEHLFILESFAEFEALARRALHEDLKSGTYFPLKNENLCNGLCHLKNATDASESQGCCNEKSRCSCGTLSGHFVCLCPPGYYGSGLNGEECLPCPNGTYHDGLTPGDETVCRPCPDNNQETVKHPATSKRDCKCKEGFVPAGDKCQVITCPQLTPPTNGYFVKKSCSKVLHAACGVRCNMGFDLSGSSVRLCQKNGTWSGTAPHCLPKSCNKLKPVPNAEIICTNEDENFEVVIRYDPDGNKTKQLIKQLDLGDGDEKIPKPYFNRSTDLTVDFNFTIDTECKFSCGNGYFLVGSKARSCLPVTRWGGLQTTCKAITCSSLSVLKNGFTSPENCTRKGIKHPYDTNCKITCKGGYLLKGPDERNCTGKYGTWTGKNIPSKCVDIEPPNLKCWDNMTVYADDGLSYATVNLTLPQAKDNSEVEPILWSVPAFDEDNPIKLNIGISEIQIFAMDGSNNNQSCSFFIEVKDAEAPKFQNCDASYTFYLSSLNTTTSDIKWEEPTVTDNSDQPAEITKNNAELGIGTKIITYTAMDTSQNKAECTVNITIFESPCSDHPSSNNPHWNCFADDSNTTICNVSCPEGFRFFSWQTYEDSNFTLTCAYENDQAYWSPEYLKKDLDTFPECLPVIEPDKASSTEEIVTEGDPTICDSLDELTEMISNEVESILGHNETDIVITSRCEDDSVSEKEETTNMIQERRKREVTRRNIHIDVSLIGSSSKYSSTDDMINRLKTSGEKIQTEYGKRDFLKLNGKKFKINKVETKKSASIVCDNGTVASNRGDYCLKCPKGTFHNLTYSTCDPCPIGQYQDLDGEMSCIHCPEGYSTRKQHSRLFKHCKKICPSGSYGRKSEYNQSSLQPCRLCDVGYYQPLQGQSSCLKCSLINETTLKKGSLHREECIQFEVITNPCHRFPCKNNGTCQLENNFASCICPVGFAGSFCEKHLDPCESSPCYNGLCVTTGPNEFRCSCASGYEGELCQIETDECESSPCENGGECNDVMEGFLCNCAAGFTGESCTENINECEYLNPCQNNGICVDRINGYGCECPKNFFGLHCEQFYECDFEIDDECSDNMVPVIDPCHSVICPDHMECKFSKENKTGCSCRKGFKGDNCIEVIDTDIVLTFPKCSVTEYLTVALPSKELEEISFCVWLQTTDDFNYGTLLSYATLDDDNAFTFTDYNGFVLYVRKKRVITDITANDGFWHFICVTWQSEGGNWHIYMDGKERANGIGLSDRSPIPGGGKLIVGQEQDRFGGGFNEVESFVGNMAYLEVWNRLLQPSEIEFMNRECRQFNGNLFTWLDFIESMHGNIQKTPSTFCKDCTSKLFLYRGSVSITTESNFTVAHYECDEGFFIKFSNQEEEDDYGRRVWVRKCLKHGDWEPNAPKCSRVKCGFPGYFPHGYITGNSYYYQDIITYRCSNGYKIQGNSTRICQADGVWSGQKPYCQGDSNSCKPLVAPRHGSMFIYFQREDSHDTHFPATGDKVEFTCDKGFRLNGADILTCTEEGIWDHDEPICEEIKCPITKEISLFIDNDSILKESYSVNEFIFIDCPSIDTERKITCHPTGRFNFSINICNVRCFDRPSPPQHGYILPDGLNVPEYEVGELTLINCNHGFKLLGDNYYNCSENGSWEQKRKTSCEPVECGPPLSLPNAEIFPNKSYFYGDRIVYKCLPGYQRYGDVSLRCEAESRWSRIRGRCIKMSCKRPEVPENMTIKGTSYLYQDTIEVICGNGSGLPENSVNYITCQANGLWSNLPQCV